MSLFHNDIKDFLLLDNYFKSAKNPVIIPHENPDGDAIGSALAFYHIFKQLNSNPIVLSPTDFPDFLKWMPGADEVIIVNHKPSFAKNIISNSDLIIFVDFNEIGRMAETSLLINNNTTPILLFDHHPNPATSVSLLFHTIEASSTAEVVFEALSEAGYENYINLDAAICIYVGIMTDTGSFSYNSSQPNTYKVVSKLLKIGINKDIIFDKVYNNFSFSRMRLLGFALNEKTIVIPELKTAYIWLTQKELKHYNFAIGDTEGFVNFPLSIAGIQISAIFIEKKDFIKISFRSKGNFYINKIASEYFNGGGHKNAAGGDYKGSMQEAIELFVNQIRLRKNEIE